MTIYASQFVMFDSWEFTIAAFQVIVGFIVAVCLSTSSLMRLSRFHTFAIGVLAFTLVTHGLHHLVLGDKYLGPASDLGYGVGVAMLVAEHCYDAIKARRGRKDKS